MWLRDRNFFQKALLFAATILMKTHLVVLFTGFLAAAGIASRDAVFRFMRLCFFEQVMRQFVKKKNPDFMILDQWALQDLWSATLFSKNGRPLAHHMRMFFGKPDVLVYFDVDARTAAERISHRTNGLSRFDSMDPESRRAALEQYGGYLHDLFDASACRSKLLLDAQRPPAKNVQLFLYHLNQLHHTPGFTLTAVVAETRSFPSHN